MKRVSFFKNLLIITVLGLLTACGGGSSSSTKDNGVKGTTVKQITG